MACNFEEATASLQMVTEEDGAGANVEADAMETAPSEEAWEEEEE